MWYIRLNFLLLCHPRWETESQGLNEKRGAGRGRCSAQCVVHTQASEVFPKSSFERQALRTHTDSLNYNYFNVSSKHSMYTRKELQWFIDTKHGKHEHSGSKKAERHKIRKAQDKQRLSNADLIPIDHFLETAGSYQLL